MRFASEGGGHSVLLHRRWHIFHWALFLGVVNGLLQGTSFLPLTLHNDYHLV